LWPENPPYPLTRSEYALASGTEHGPIIQNVMDAGALARLWVYSTAGLLSDAAVEGLQRRDVRLEQVHLGPANRSRWWSVGRDLCGWAAPAPSRPAYPLSLAGSRLACWRATGGHDVAPAIVCGSSLS